MLQKILTLKCLISTLSSENDLEAEIERFYLGEENKKKIIVFKFSPEETDIMNYIKFFIENHVKEKNYEDEKNKKAFIFSVHMNRIFEEDKDKDKYIERNKLGELLSHLSDFYQLLLLFLHDYKQILNDINYLLQLFVYILNT